jgi:hypothetical protein
MFSIGHLAKILAFITQAEIGHDIWSIWIRPELMPLTQHILVSNYTFKIDIFWLAIGLIG